MGATSLFSKFAKLLDRTTVDLPTLNTPLADALAAKADSSSLSYVALSGSYDDLIDVPSPSPGVSEVADLTDATTYAFPTLNTPVADALAGKANSADLGTISTFEGDQNLRMTDPATFANLTASGTVTGGSVIGDNLRVGAGNALLKANGTGIIARVAADNANANFICSDLNSSSQTITSGTVRFQLGANIQFHGSPGSRQVLISSPSSGVIDFEGATSGSDASLTGLANITASGTVTAGGSIQAANVGIGISPSGIYKVLQSGGIYRIQDAGRLEIDASNDQALKIVNGGNTVFQVDTNSPGGTGVYIPTGNLGIGTASPTSKFQVSDTFNTYIDGSGLAAGANVWSDTSMKIGVSSNNSLSFFTNAVSRGYVKNTGELIWTGNVGIGTTTPDAALHVAGVIPIAPTGSGVLMGLQSNYGIVHLNGSTGGILDFSSSGVDRKGRILYDNAGNYMQIQTNGSDKVRIDSSGNVGIGTTTPTEKLDVSGYIKASTGFRMGNYTILSEGGNETILSNTAFYGLLFKTNNATRMKITNAGNVGIGTTSPSANLHVVGDVKIGNSSTGLTMNADSATEFLVQGVDTSGGAWNSIHLTADSLTGLYIEKDTNNVGIGTTAPAEKLDVVGNITASGTVKTGSKTVAAANALSGVAAGSLLWITNEAGGPCTAEYNGTAWVRVRDQIAISV
jgi:hypothetical protein